jgi:integral membrane protein
VTADAGVTGRGSAGPVAVPAAVRGALLRYRVIAYVVGVGLILLVCVGVPLKYASDVSWVVAVVGPLHGVLYVIYLLLTLDLARRVRMNPVFAVAVMLAGTIPFLSFVAERKVSHYVLAPGARR